MIYWDTMNKEIRICSETRATTHTRYVAYYRVSTLQQGQSGLGLEAQRETVERFANQTDCEIIASMVETESGKKHNRPQLLAALDLCRRKKAVLLIAKLDRLARNVHFVSGLLESGVQFVAADQPTKDKFMLHVQAAFAEEEARRISLRTKEALSAAKRRGVIIGATGKLLAQRYRQEAKEKARFLRPLFQQLSDEGARTTMQFRDRLNALAVPSPGGGRWHVPNTYRALKRLEMIPDRSWRSQPKTVAVQQAECAV